jgi:hypothetical protein
MLINQGRLSKREMNPPPPPEMFTANPEDPEDPAILMLDKELVFQAPCKPSELS